jgi:cholesterol transport system auxiliary component
MPVSTFAPTRRAMLALLPVSAALAGCAGGGIGAAIAPPASDTFDLTAPRIARRAGRGGRVLVVQEPQTTLRVLDGDRIVVRPRPNEINFLPGAQWADRLPRLVQTRLIETFQNTSRLASVGRSGEGLDAQLALLSEIRAFEIEAFATPTAKVEIVVRLAGTRSTRVERAEVFQATAPVGAIEPRNAALALDRALGEVMGRIVAWTSL